MILISQDGTIAINTDLVSSFQLSLNPYVAKTPTIFAHFPDGLSKVIGEFEDEKTARIVFESIIHTTATAVKQVPKTIKEEKRKCTR